MSAVKYCQEMFPCEILSITPQRRLEKFENERYNIETILIMFLVKILYACVYVCIGASIMQTMQCYSQLIQQNERRRC